MNSLLQAFASPGWTHFVQTLLHTLWQGVIIALLLAVILRSVPVRRTNVRYAFSLCALVSLLFSGLMTWAILGLEKAPPTSARTAFAPISPQDSAIEQNSIGAPPIALHSNTKPASVPAASHRESPTQSWVIWAAAFWMAGCAVMICRLLSGLVDLRRIRQRCQVVLDPALDAMVARLQTAMGMARRVVILTGEHIQMPSVFGVFLPRLLLPPALLTGIPIAQLEAILAHELAHIRRHDFLVNLAQEILEALLFFNPAVWWINHQIRHEREACCDRMAIAATGQTETYARTLTDWAERSHNGSLALAPAFGEPTPGGPLDRLKRLLAPGYRPAIRLPWYSFAGIFIISGICLFGLWRGTNLAVAVAARILTPAERVQKMAEIQASHGIKPEAQREYTKKDDVTISGTIRTEDGSPVPSNCHFVGGNSQRPHHSSSIGLDIKGKHFSGTANFGEIHLFLKANGFAPASLGPLKTTPGGSLTNLELVLRRGFPAKLRFLNNADQPITNVVVRSGYRISPETKQPFELKTDARGEATMKDCLTNLVWDFEATAEGYQYDERKRVTFKPDEPLIWRLRDVKPASGIVVSKKTGHPIAGARVQMIWREGAFSGSWAFESRPLLATTDEQGRFTVRQLSDNTAYIFFIEAPGFAPCFLRKVTSGQAGLKVEMGPELVIKGKILGDLSRLRTDKKLKTLTIHPSMKLGIKHENNHGLYTNVPIEVRDGIGYFEYRGLWEGEHSISAQDFRTNFMLRAPMEDFTVDLSSAVPDAETLPKRKVVFHFDIPAGSPTPTNFTFWYSNETERQPSHKKNIPIKNGEAHAELPVPGQLSVERNSVHGYWTLPDLFSFSTIEAGTNPFITKLSLIPAGAIFGKVLDTDGSEVSGVMISVCEAKPSPLKKDNYSLGVNPKNSSSSADGPTRFSAQPLPLGGEYQIVAHRGNSYVTSDVIPVTEKEPLREITLRFAPGQELGGRVVDDQGHPLPMVAVELGYAPQKTHGFGGSKVLTDANGAFHFTQVNADASGSYALTVEQFPGFQPLRQTVDFRKLPVTLQLQKGLIVTGQVLDDATGWPIPDADIYAIPVTWQPSDRGGLESESKTNEKGEFRFSNMDKREYKIQCRDGVIASGARNKEPIASPEAKNFIVLRVKLYEWSKLKPHKPSE